MGQYFLRCTGCGRDHEDDGLRTACGGAHAPSLLRTVYAEKRFNPDQLGRGILRYRQWLPLRNAPATSGLSATFQSDALNALLETPNLWLAFSGYWPQRGAFLTTATFKELEAQAIVSRFPRDGTVLVAPSAGNTAASLAAACSAGRIPALIVVPDGALAGLRFAQPIEECVKFIAIADGTYDDAIAFAREVATIPGFEFEGGAANVARRDGIGTTMLHSVEVIGALPDYYVQAIGSGAGAIAAHEAAQRLCADGRFGTDLPRLLLVQNAPSSPVHSSWQARSRLLLTGDDDATQRAAMHNLSAKVLGVRIPPYSQAGGLFSVLSESAGDTIAVANAQARTAAGLFEELEGIDIEPAAAVAIAGLQAALLERLIDRDARILLHLTGGGRSASLALRPYSAGAELVVPHLCDARESAAMHATRLFVAA
jgi:cysteate synthase